ncbi:MAG: chloramphenicol phosphotransferase [Dehalococcoidia bacterium]|nr:chloramphenicol phosphotransferase [Dehalococcoidia bacterium]
MQLVPPGQVVILNGAPRSGKSSIAAAILETLDGWWMNLGVDLFMQATAPRLQPGIGLRPGGERPDLEPFVGAAYAALYASVAAHASRGINVVVDVGHHSSYSRPMQPLRTAAGQFAGLPVLFVGVRCPVEVIMARRNAGQSGREGRYVTSALGAPVPEPVLRWHEAVHAHREYDLEVDTSLLSPRECAAAIRARLDSGPPGTALHTLVPPDTGPAH